ncbi:hypothetical protein [Pseudonocardia sp. NPDC049154]|uniref:hypothetical protein n=1 Tax=Pseudonocardia sp. NPDC049154 TaxID=3155501 RepID=UPI0034020E30
MDRPDGSDEPRQPADTPEPTAAPDAGETPKAPGDAATTAPRDAAPEACEESAGGRSGSEDGTAGRTTSEEGAGGHTGSDDGPGRRTGSADATVVVPTAPAPPTQTGIPTADATETGRPVLAASDAPQYPGQRYPAVPGREGEPEIPGEQPWGPPPGHAWSPPSVERREQRTGRWIAGLSAVIVLALAAIGGGAWFLVTALSGPTVPAGYRPVDTPYLTYAVPGDWTPLDDVAARGLGVAFTGGADAPGYVCRGDPYKRGTATSALVQAPDDPATLARRFAAEFGRSFYTSTAGQGPRVTLSEPRTVEIGDATGVVVEAVSTTPVDDGCLATGGRTQVLAVPVAGGTALLVANADTTGGPATPPLVPPSTVEDVIGSAALPR